MDFSKLGFGKELHENVDVLQVQQGGSDRAVEGGTKQREGTRNRLTAQKSQRSTHALPQKSGISYASESYNELRRMKEIHRMREMYSSDWRTEIKEGAEENDEARHPYVDVMPRTNQREKKMAFQMKQAKDQKKAETAKVEEDFKVDYDQDCGLDAALDKLIDESSAAMDFMKKKYAGKLIDTTKPAAKAGMFNRSREEQARRSKNWHDNQKGKDPYKARPGESD